MSFGTINPVIFKNIISGNWAVQPTSVSQALDRIAAKIAALHGTI